MGTRERVATRQAQRRELDGEPSADVPLAPGKRTLTMRLAEAATRGRRQDSADRIPAALRRKMEAAFGEDFSRVVVHPDSRRAPAIGAEAFTEGEHIHLAPGRYDPGNRSGQELLGHELAHVVQQRAGRASATSTVGGAPLSDDRCLEREADALGRRAAANEAAPAAPPAPAPMPAVAGRAPIQRKLGSNAHDKTVGRAKEVRSGSMYGAKLYRAEQVKNGLYRLIPVNFVGEPIENVEPSDDRWDPYEPEEHPIVALDEDEEEPLVAVGEEAAPDRRADARATFLVDAKEFLHKPMRVRRAELGEPGLDDLLGQYRVTDDDVAALDRGEAESSEHALVELDDAADSSSSDLVSLDDSQNPDPDLEIDAAILNEPLEARDSKLTAMFKKGFEKAKNKSLSMVSGHESRKVVLLAIEMTVTELKTLWNDGFVAMFRELGAKGVAGYLENQVLAKIVDHMDLQVKEMVPWSGERHGRDKAAQIGEGTLDVAWNLSGATIDTLSAEAAMVPVALAGASYKGGLAADAVTRHGGRKKKATEIGAITFLIEFLNGLTAYYGQATAIVGGAQQIYEASGLKKAIARRTDPGALRLDSPKYGHPKAQQVIDGRRGRVEALIDRARAFPRDPEVEKVRKKLEEKRDYLSRQSAKITRRSERRDSERGGLVEESRPLLSDA